VDGDLEVEQLEKKAGGFTTEHLGLHARVSAILKVGAAAVSRLHGRHQDMGWVSRFQDQLAILSQIGDDLQDLASDLKDGRFTWVANTLLAAKPSESIGPRERARRLGEGFLRPERGALIVKELRRIVRAAAAEVPESAPRPIHDLVLRLRAMPDKLERRMHEARVRWVFGEALPPRRRSRSGPQYARGRPALDSPAAGATLWESARRSPSRTRPLKLASEESQ
jgi:hypothetical protein